MSKLPTLDLDRFQQEQLTRDNPLAATPLGELIRIFLDNQKIIGLRQFAERTRIPRRRLSQIIAGEPPTEAEVEAISTLFTTISDRHTRRNVKRHVTSSPA